MFELLGVNSQTKQCCILKSSRLTFPQLLSLLKQYPDIQLAFEHSATNWEGRDSTERTLELKRFRRTGRKIPYTTIIYGADHDMGHTYHWSFLIDEIHEIE